ncbi:MAG: hypothetical protein ACRDVW_09485, partial [Acidimicrobiales bacterium]
MGQTEFYAPVRISRPAEAAYHQHGRIMPYVMRQLLDDIRPTPPAGDVSTITSRGRQPRLAAVQFVERGSPGVTRHEHGTTLPPRAWDHLVPDPCRPTVMVVDRPDG